MESDENELLILFRDGEKKKFRELQNNFSRASW
jgi:hypothetical protein